MSVQNSFGADTQSFDDVVNDAEFRRTFDADGMPPLYPHPPRWAVDDDYEIFEGDAPVDVDTARQTRNCARRAASRRRASARRRGCVVDRPSTPSIGHAHRSTTTAASPTRSSTG
mmetsp:Transcript_4776/g.14920  ORF Transcript_4776/g.14920 Transcript_4776/m.14920 type:complete len:115 (+) Transcript_4776:168-512(+)